MKKFLIYFLIAFSIASQAVSEMTYFSFSDEPIDVVIPCVEKDLLTLNLCIEGIRKNGKNIRDVYIVSRLPLSNKAKWYSENKYPFSLEDVKQVLSKNDPEHYAQLEVTGRTGWYFQQLLKLYAPLVIPGISSNVLVLDADTIFLNPVSFMNEENAGLYNVGIEHYKPYFEHAHRMVPGLKRCFPEYSGITHHMLLQKPVLEHFFEEVECNHKAPFWEAFLSLVDPTEIVLSGASEYELYFNYVFSRTDQVSVRKLKWKNIERMSSISKLKHIMHYVSVHSHSRLEE